MRLLISGGGSNTLLDCYRAYPALLGFLVTPSNLSRIATASKGLAAPWAADNGAYAGFDPEAFRRLLRRITGRPGCLFVVVPDVWGDSRATTALFERWAPEVSASGQPLAYVGQDGAENIDLPWAEMGAYFVGGSDRWRRSAAARDVMAEARQRGKWLHLGRVNSMRRLASALDLGCDSCDGSSYSKWSGRAETARPDMSLARHLAFLAQLQAAPTLF